ncbi:MAG TPA: VWA domain-containing protein [Blastocatellia bacterium]|nr:VWA domain-containing protein [Blastocatellia bacterium]
MHFNIKTLLVVGLLTANLLYAGPRVQTGSEQQKDQKVVVSGVEVPVDVIVRDKAGRPVKGLTAADFEVYENGVLQPITSVRLVTRELAEAETAAKTATPSKPVSGSPASNDVLAGMTTTALIFDRLTPEGRPRARDAALNYVNENMKSGSRMGVYITGLALQVLQPPTQDAQLVKAAVERTGEVSGAIYQTNIQESRQVRDQLSGFVQGYNPAARPEGDPFYLSKKDMLTLQLQLSEGFEALQREQQGHATINGLTAVVNSLRAIPGRKAVIFFSEGIALPSNVEPFMRALISTANAANVSIYTIDAAGLRVESAQTETKKEIESRSNLRMTELATSADHTGPMTKELERNEDILRLDPRSGLGLLADQTGGFLINNTNDFKGRMGRIDEELRTYYMLSYAPKDQAANGQFRRIEVKVKRSGVTVQARKGYYAINSVFDSPVLEYETPALAIAASGRGPKDLPVRSSAMSFPETTRTGLVTAVAEVPMQALAIRTDEKTKTFATDFSVVMTFKSAANDTVTKMSHHYALTGPMANLAALQKQDIQFYREGELAPGRYQVQTVVYDALAKKAGVLEGTFEVPAASDTDLRLSDIVFIKRTERLNAEEQKTFNPFHVGELLAYPNLGEVVSKAKSKQLSFFFTAYVPKGSSAPPKLMLELSQQGQTLAQLPAELPAADATGRIQFAGGLPLESIPPGTYDLKAIVTSGGKSVARSARLVIE